MHDAGVLSRQEVVCQRMGPPLRVALAVAWHKVIHTQTQTHTNLNQYCVGPHVPARQSTGRPCCHRGACPPRPAARRRYPCPRGPSLPKVSARMRTQTTALPLCKYAAIEHNLGLGLGVTDAPDGPHPHGRCAAGHGRARPRCLADAHRRRHPV
jgi:hypothetical protein